MPVSIVDSSRHASTYCLLCRPREDWATETHIYDKHCMSTEMMTCSLVMYLLIASVCAEAIVQLLAIDAAEGRKYSIASKEGDGPGTDPAKWKALLGV